MGLFSRKPKTSIDEFCRKFYDSMVFHPTIAGEDFNAIWWDTVFQSVVDADEFFGKIDKTLFQQEMTAIRLELFALAWMHKFKRDKYTIPQSIFTQHYLEENGKLDTWDAMERYNLAVAQTATMTTNGQQMTGRTRAERFVITMVNSLRAELFDKWASAHMKDPSKPNKKEKKLLTCVARVGNRIEADLMKNNKIGNQRLTALLLYRLGWKEDEDLSEEAFFRLVAIIFGLYEGAKEAIRPVNLQVD